MMRASLSTILLVALTILLVACQPGTLQGTPLPQQPAAQTPAIENTTPDACAGINCATGEICTDGSCGCAQGNKRCGDSCISEDSCCSDDDCSNAETCEQGSCTFDCSSLSCPTGTTCDASTRRCECRTGYKWCERQESCIPNDHCCSRFDCGTNERCTDTITTAEICVENQGKSCKIFNTIGSKTLSIPAGSYDINLTRVTYLDSVDLVVDGQALTLGGDDSATLGDATISVKKFRETGGECRDFDAEN